MSATFTIVSYLGGYCWVLTHGNGTQLAKSATIYTRKSDAKRAISRARTAFRSATVVA